MSRRGQFDGRHAGVGTLEVYEAIPEEEAVNTLTFTELDGRTILTLLVQHTTKEFRAASANGRVSGHEPLSGRQKVRTRSYSSRSRATSGGVVHVPRRRARSSSVAPRATAQPFQT